MAKHIPLTQGQVAIVDDEDYERVSAYRWCAHRSRNNFYAVRRLPDGKDCQLSAFVIGVEAGIIVDHINCATLDNRRNNLRVATNAQNSRNKKKRHGTSSAYKGVSIISKTQRWRAQIKVNYKTVHLGCFATDYEAAQAYDKAAVKYFGKFARLNLVQNAES